jgi:hypothetical protein
MNHGYCITGYGGTAVSVQLEAVEPGLSYRKSCSFVAVLSVPSRGSNFWSIMLILYVPCFVWKLIYISSFRGHIHDITKTQPICGVRGMSIWSLMSNRVCTAPRAVCMVPDRAYLMMMMMMMIIIIILWRDTPQWATASSFTGFLDHTQRRTTVGRTPLDEWSARRRDLYLTTQNNHNDKHPCPRWDSNPQSQQASGRRTSP